MTDRARPKTTTPTSELPFPPGQVPPKPVAWLHPVELLRTAYHSFVANVLTGYIDRREVLAALAGNTNATRNPHGTNPRDVVERDSADEDFLNFENVHGDIWIDFVADIGDSWDATYATATMLARQNLTVRGLQETLPAADLVALGGDLVYPVPNREAYRTRTRSAFLAALPPPRNNQEQSPPPPRPRRYLVTIPGNHDWYDGLTSYLREFCGGGMYAGWKLSQGRSYFAVKLPNDWWLWGIDIALDSRIDGPQQRYFLNLLAEQFTKAGEKNIGTLEIPIILCTAKPVWLGNPRHSNDAYNNLAYFADLIRTHRCNTRVILSGDIHHYSRFESDAGEQMIVAGGGGAYLNGTHQVPASVPEVKDPRPIEEGQRITPSPDDSRTQPPKRFRAAEYPYPSRAVSRRLALRAALLALRPANWPFVLFLGTVYAILAKSIQPLFLNANTACLCHGESLTQLQPLVKTAFTSAPILTPTGTLLVLVLCSAMTVVMNRGSWLGRAIWGALHGATHIVLMLWFATLIAHPRLPTFLCGRLGGLGVFSDGVLHRLVILCLLAIFILVAGFVGATLVGVFFVVSDRFFSWHMNEAFVVQSITDYRNFLRMKLAANGTLTIYPIGLQRVPQRWRARATQESDVHLVVDPAAGVQPRKPLYEPGDAMIEPHLIEAPVVVWPQNP